MLENLIPNLIAVRSKKSALCAACAMEYRRPMPSRSALGYLLGIEHIDATFPSLWVFHAFLVIVQ